MVLWRCNTPMSGEATVERQEWGRVEEQGKGKRGGDRRFAEGKPRSGNNI